MAEDKTKEDRKSPRPFPQHSLEEALAVARAIQDKGAGKPMNRVLLAGAIPIGAGSSEYRLLLSSSFKYGLTEGTEKAPTVSLTPLGARLTRPKSAEEEAAARREAALKPDLLSRVYRHYNNAKLPSGQFFWNTLETEFKVPREHTEELEKLLADNGRFAKLLRTISGSTWVVLDENAVEEEPTEQEEGTELAQEEVNLPPKPAPAAAPSAPAKPGAIFIAHGKNRTPLEQLKRVLDSFKVPYKVAVEEPHSGRPISEKVANIMRECSAGIFIFTADEEFYDKAGSPIYRPSENVVFELGAGSTQYGNKMVIFKQDGVSFPTDFRDLGYISFEMDRLDAKASELVKELIGFGILRVSVA